MKREGSNPPSDKAGKKGVTPGHVLALRAHHLPNLKEYVKDGIRMHFNGRLGYSDAFGRAHDEVLERIASDPNRKILLVETTDSICMTGVCPKFNPECAKEEGDRAHAAMFGLAVNTEYTAGELMAAVSKPVLTLREVALKSGERMTIKLVTPPAEEYLEKLLRFLEHKPDAIRRNIKQRLQGHYAKYCVDKFFVGEIEGKIVGQVWYGYSNSGTGIANFGEVYTEPEYRRRGISRELMKVFINDFWNSPAVAALCTAGDMAAGMYMQFGFQTVVPGTSYGPMILIRKGLAENFAEFEKEYYKPGSAVSVVPGTMKHRHDIDTLLRYSTILRRRRENWASISGSGARLAGRVGPAYGVPNYMEACFMAEDGKGQVFVAVTDQGNVVGWAFLLNPASQWEQKSMVFDYEIAPTYTGSAGLLVRESMRLAGEGGAQRAWAWYRASDSGKIDPLLAAGFAEAGRLPDYFVEGEAASDMVVLRFGK
jgi:GNAT superfamily N-acetyltransferase